METANSNITPTMNVNDEPEAEQLDYKPGGAPIYSQATDKNRELNRNEYQDEEADLTCARFPHLNECNCEVPTKQALADIQLVEVHDGIFMGPF
jgi:hypothetical protein